MDIRSSEAARLYQAVATLGTRPSEGDAGSLSGTMAETASSFIETLRAAETTAQEAMAGKADPHALVEALAQTELAIETAVTLRNKVVEAYQEILRMPV